jgi:hypothetical protein
MPDHAPARPAAGECLAAVRADLRCRRRGTDDLTHCNSIAVRLRPRDIVLPCNSPAVTTGIGIVLFLPGRMERKVEGKAERLDRALTLRHPDQPWLWREDCARGYATPESLSNTPKMAAIGSICLLICAPLEACGGLSGRSVF